jgi:methyltransferase (TIGR00027 family)
MARTEDDSWDLASSVGATATMVAGQRVLGHREGLIDDPYAEPLVRAVGVDFINRILDGEVSFEDVDPSFTARLAAEGMAVRTRFFDRLFVDAAAAGVRQAVILAAGLDARAYRLDWPDGMTVYEVDQPEVIAFKTRTLAGIGAEPRAAHRVVAIDLRENWPKVLRDNGFDSSQPTAWIAEGLLIYLPPEAQDKLFDESPHCRRRAAGWPPSGCTTSRRSSAAGRGRSRRRCANSARPSRWRSWCSPESGRTSSSISANWAGPSPRSAPEMPTRPTVSTYPTTS